MTHHTSATESAPLPWYLRWWTSARPWLFSGLVGLVGYYLAGILEISSQPAYAGKGLPDVILVPFTQITAQNLAAGALSFLIGYAFTHLRKECRVKVCPYFEREPDTQTVVMSLEGLLRDTDGLYDSLDDAHIPLGMNSLRSKLKVMLGKHSDWVPGLVFIRNDCSFGEYASLALALDDKDVTQRCVKSTNLYLPSQTFPDEDPGVIANVKRHLDMLNQRDDILVLRAQVLRPNESTGAPKAVHSKTEFEADKTAHTSAKTTWETVYAKESHNHRYRELSWDEHILKQQFYGDYITYDDELVLLYSAGTRVLMVLVGKKLASKFTNVFEDWPIGEMGAASPPATAQAHRETKKETSASETQLTEADAAGSPKA